MKRLRQVVIAFVLLLVVLLAGLAAWLALAPPALLRVGAGYTAKIVCSNVFLAGRDPKEVLAVDVQAPGHPLLRLMEVDVDRQARRVRAALLGVFAANQASYREGVGCSVGPNGDVADAAGLPETPAAPAPGVAPWAEGEQLASDQAIGARV